tara:strand:+ start:50 stop:601 length:552 start_codon:yes stop_codon:yes gene_type:complete
MNSSGFGFIEIIVVLVIMGLLAAFAVPSLMKYMPNMEVKNAANDLRSGMQRMRLESVKRNINTAIVFDTTNGSYSLCTSSGGDGNWTTLGDNTVVETVALSTYKYGINFGKGNAANAVGGGAFPVDSVSFSGVPDNSLVFTPRGLCDAGFVYITNDDSTASYAVGTQASGVIMSARWLGGTWE